MGIWGLVKRSLAERFGVSTGWGSSAGWFGQVFGRPTESGESVTPQNVMQLPTVYACVSIISRTMATLPVHAYLRLDEQNREQLRDHWFQRLKQAPNEYMDWVVFQRFMWDCRLLQGNAITYIERDNRDRPVGLWPWRPWRTKWRLKDNELWYELQTDGTPLMAPARDVWHWRGRTIDGVTGLSPIQEAAEAFGSAVALQRFAAQFWANSAVVSGALEMEGRPSDDAKEALRKEMIELHSGRNRHSFGIFHSGAKWKQISVTPDQAQFLQTNQLKKIDICQIFGVPPHKVQILEHQTFTNIEHQGIDWTTDTVRPFAVENETSAAHRLIPPAERPEVFIEYNLEGLQRGDFETRMRGWASAVQNGMIHRNYVAARENFPPLPPDIGNKYTVQLSMVDLKDLGAEPEPAGNRGNIPRDPQDTGKAPPAKRLSISTATAEQRSRQQVKLRDRFKRRMREAAEKVVIREAREIEPMARKAFEERNTADFLAMLAEFRAGHERYVARTLGPVLAAMGEAVATISGQQVGEDEPDIEALLNAYIETAGKRRAGYLVNRLRNILEQAEEGRELDDVLGELDNIKENHSERMAKEEVVKLAGAVSRAVWEQAGVERYQWVTVGEHCPMCGELDGVIVGRGESFVGAGDAAGGGDRTPVRPPSNILHPPLHDGCECDIVPV